jgi:hypothetical protein
MTLAISAVGYSTQIIKTGSVPVDIRLERRVIDGGEVIVKPTNTKNSYLTINKLKNRVTNLHFVCSRQPWIVARFFDYKPEYGVSPIISEIRILTESSIRSADFNLRILRNTGDDTPGEDILKSNYIIHAGSGQKTTTIDISRLNITIPEEGIFIAGEWLMIESNKREFSYKSKSSSVKQTETRYEPGFGAIEKDNPQTWVYSGGNWRKWANRATPSKVDSWDLAVELFIKR